jgi:hypothetical protein
MPIADPELTLIRKFSTLIGGDLRQRASEMRGCTQQIAKRIAEGRPFLD